MECVRSFPSLQVPAPSLSRGLMKDAGSVSGAIWKEVSHYCVNKNEFISWTTKTSGEKTEFNSKKNKIIKYFS
jgi:hypothetical protein